MDWSSVIIGISSAAGALGLNEAVRVIINKWANKKKEAVSVRDNIADLEAKDIVNREKTFAMLSGINDKLVDEMTDLTQKLIEARSQMSEVINHKITLTMENAELKAQNEIFKKENDQSKKSLAELKAQNELMHKENEQLKKSLSELEAKLAKMEKQIKELEKKI
jgi:predicted nuclease with TOPRIM domain